MPQKLFHPYLTHTLGNTTDQILFLICTNQTALRHRQEGKGEHVLNVNWLVPAEYLAAGITSCAKMTIYELFEFLATHIENTETLNTGIITNGEDVVSNTNINKNKLSPCTHEEADSRLV